MLLARVSVWECVGGRVPQRGPNISSCSHFVALTKERRKRLRRCIVGGFVRQEDGGGGVGRHTGGAVT